MAQRYNQGFNYAGATRFVEAPLSQVEFSSMNVDPTWYVPFNAGDIVPCFYEEVLPHSTFQIDLDYIVRQVSASVRPTMGQMICDVFCYWIPNRVVNDSWRNVLGENSSGYWSAPQIELAPLTDKTSGYTTIPVDSIGDLLGFPTQAPIPNYIFAQMNDLKPKMYLACYNEYFRDQNYQPPKSFSKLNVFQGFLEPTGTQIGLQGISSPPSIRKGQVADGSYAGGAIVKSLLGEGSSFEPPAGITGTSVNLVKLTDFSLLDKPLKANKLHDAFTSVLPSPQKGPEVVFSVSSDIIEAPLDTSPSMYDFTSDARFRNSSEFGNYPYAYSLNLAPGQNETDRGTLIVSTTSTGGSSSGSIDGSNLVAVVDLSEATGITVNDLRSAVATQHVLELLARGGSRYWSFLKSFFGIEADNPYPDIPTQIGHMRRTMDLYQVAQTSAESETQQGVSTPSSLSAFGYSTKGGSMFTKTFIEHGYIMSFVVVRQRNAYSTYLAPDNFRRKTMDFYLPQLANIGEQPIRLATLNPFRPDAMDKAIGYQEAWWEYRYSPDRILGSLRSGVPGSLDIWHFGDYYDSSFEVIDGDWLISDAQEVLDRTLYVDSSQCPQFIGQFMWKIKKQLPMPVYSVPGLDTI